MGTDLRTFSSLWEAYHKAAEIQVQIIHKFTIPFTLTT